MPPKAAAKKTTDIDDLFSDLPSADDAGKSKTSTGGGAGAASGKHDQAELDALADLDELRKLTERPATPRAGARKSGEAARKAAAAPVPGSDPSKKATVEDVPSASDLADAAASTGTKIVEEAPAAAGSWWGGFVASATAAVKSAEAAVKDLQSSEEGKRWAEQLQGNVEVLKTYGGELRSKALPTLTNILNTIAPPISSHERLQIHITHDLRDYPSLDPLIHGVFARVMQQVEGGDLLVIQRGQENKSASATSSYGWHDGPWYRAEGDNRSVNPVAGSAEGQKLCLAAADGFSKEFYAANGGLEAAVKAATETLSDDNPVRKSDIFLAIQAISHNEPAVTEGEPEDELISFAVVLRDEVHSIAFQTLSQSVPKQWIDWLDSTTESVKDIHEILASGGVDPREWAAEWLEESLSLAIGTVAQRYVARRMGLGVAKGKEKAAE